MRNFLQLLLRNYPIKNYLRGLFKEKSGNKDNCCVGSCRKNKKITARIAHLNLSSAIIHIKLHNNIKMISLPMRDYIPLQSKKIDLLIQLNPVMKKNTLSNQI